MADMIAPDQTALAVRFAEGLSKVKRAHDRNGGTILTADEVHGLIWGIRTLRGAADYDAADSTA